MDIRKIRKLIDLMIDSDLQSLEVKEGEHSVSMSRRGNNEPQVLQQSTAPLVVQQKGLEAEVVNTAPAAEEVPTGTLEYSPMVGMFYSAPGPDEPNFVKVGQTINVGDTLGIVEAMKIMNPIQATQSGVVTELLAENGKVLQFGDPILVLKAD